MEDIKILTREEVEVTACPMCDGCDKLIDGERHPTFWRWTFETPGGYGQGQLDSHKLNSCVGKVMTKIFE
jgi:hypothetical protein